jgi:hypothetical protein
MVVGTSLEQVAHPRQPGLERRVLQDPGHLIDRLADELARGDPLRERSHQRL